VWLLVLPNNTTLDDGGLITLDGTFTATVPCGSRYSASAEATEHHQNGFSVNDASGGIVNHGTLTSQPGRCRKTSPSMAAGSSATSEARSTADDSTLSGNNAFLPGGGIWSTSKTLTVRNLRDCEGEWIGY
jgi:hypothetical protein